MKLNLDLDFYVQFENSDNEEWDFDSADEESMKAVSEYLGHHRTDRELMNAYLGAVPVK
jgi:hypothetical protein